MADEVTSFGHLVRGLVDERAGTELGRGRTSCSERRGNGSATFAHESSSDWLTEEFWTKLGGFRLPCGFAERYTGDETGVGLSVGCGVADLECPGVELRDRTFDFRSVRILAKGIRDELLMFGVVRVDDLLHILHHAIG